MLSLFLLFGDEAEQVLFSFDEVVVAKTLSVLRVPRLVEIVHV